jgi:hypothetical protein
MLEVEARQVPGDLLEFGEKLTLFRFRLSPCEQQLLDAMLLQSLRTNMDREGRS